MKVMKVNVISSIDHSIEKYNVTEVDEKPMSSQCLDLACQFSNATALPGLSHISKSGSIYGKVFWMVILVAGISLSTIQSIELVSDYLKTTIEVENNPILPAVTICANSLLNLSPFNKQSLAIWKDFIKPFSMRTGPTTLETLPSFLKRQFYEMFSKLPLQQRIELGFSLAQLEHSCKTGSSMYTCPGDVVTFHSMKYGNCYTINSQYKPKSYAELPVYLARRKAEGGLSKFSDPIKSILHVYPNIFTNSTPELAPVVFIHPQNTSPTLIDAKAINLYPDTWTTIKLQRKIIKRQKSPYTSHCVDGNESTKENNYYHTYEYPYEYTMDACIKTCLRREAIRICNCTDKEFATLSQTSSDMHKYCVLSDCFWLTANTTLNTCDCPQRCEELIYIVDETHNLRKFIHGDDDELCTILTAKDGTMHRMPKALSNVSGFEIYFSGDYYEVITEEPQTSLPMVLGSIGGSIGLWIGISVFSFTEIISFMLDILCVPIKRARYLCKKHRV